MKRLYNFLLVFLLFGSSLQAQVITITFEGTLNGSSIPLDSILVMNLTAGGDTTIYFPDNVLVLDGTTGLQEMDSEAPVLCNQPNPFTGATDVLLSTRISGQTLLIAHDATGREVAAYAGSLAAGQHRFRFTAAIPGVHLLTVVQDDERATHRLVALAGEGNASGLTYAGINSTGGDAKSGRSLFTWTPGDELRYIGYATSGGVLHSAATDEVPIATATHTFSMSAGATCPNAPYVTDIDGNIYTTTLIGNQCWMAENLRTATYSDGSAIPNVTDNAAWSQLTSGAWCNYNNSPANDAIYGKHYNWYAASNPNICPLGWHMPTDAEWQQLEATLGMPGGELGQLGLLGDAQNVGGKMKAAALWSTPNMGANNESGFSGLPGGYRYYLNSVFINIANYGYWWSASEADPVYVWFRFLNNDVAGIFRNPNPKGNGCCIRCVRD